MGVLTGFDARDSLKVPDYLNWITGNPLFQKGKKILDETYLEGSGPMIQEALNKLKINKII